MIKRRSRYLYFGGGAIFFVCAIGFFLYSERTENQIDAVTSIGLVGDNSLTESSGVPTNDRLSNGTRVDETEASRHDQVVLESEESRLLSAESRLMNGESVNTASVRSLFESGRFPEYVAVMNEQMNSDPVAGELGRLYRQVMEESLSGSGYSLENFACGRTVCAGSALHGEGDMSWESVMQRVEEGYGQPFHTTASTWEYRDGQLVRNFVVTTAPENNSLYFPRMPEGGIVFGGPAPDPVAPDPDGG